MALVYRDNYLSCSREELIDLLRSRLKPSRFKHVLRVETTAIEIAQHLGEDLEKVSVSALMHDYAKDMYHQEMYQLAYAYCPHEDLRKANTAIWHGFAAAYICREEFGCQDESILQAIASHTIGAHQMDLLAQIIYIADYIEPGRQFDAVEQARRLAKGNLSEAVDFKMIQTIHHLLDQRHYIFPLTIEIYNARITHQK